MIKTLKRKFYNILYSLPFGMKGAEDEMLSQKSSLNTDNVGVHQVINENRLSKDLLKGEVTQQVEELRYRDYKVSRESKKYKYLGEGIAVKKDLISNSTRLIQENKLIVKTVSEELNRVDKETYAIDEYTLKIVYDSFPKFKLEKYCNYFEIIDNKHIFRSITNSSIKIEVRASAIIEANKSVETIVECFEFSSDASEFKTLLESIEGYDITPVFEEILDSENNPTGKQYTIYTLERGSYSITIKHDTSINKIEINATYSDGKDIYKGITYNKG